MDAANLEEEVVAEEIEEDGASGGADSIVQYRYSYILITNTRYP